MSQGIFNNINPEVVTGLMLSQLLNAFKNAVATNFSGATRPPNLQVGGFWINNINQGTPSYYLSLMLYSGDADIEIFRVSLLTGVAGLSTTSNSYSVTKISSDTVGAFLNLIKERVAGGGQVKSGDTIATINFIGRTDGAANPIVSQITVTAVEDETTAGSGVTVSFKSTAASTAAIVEHFRFLQGYFETVKPHKVNSMKLVSANVATSSTLELVSDQMMSELTGSTAADILGIEVGTLETRVKHIHNRSTAIATVKHESTSASTAARRFSLPGAKDLKIAPDASASFYYDTTNSRWKLLSAGNRPQIQATAIQELRGCYNEWVAPSDGVVSIVGYRDQTPPFSLSGTAAIMARDQFGMLYSWGYNASGQIGDNTRVPKSSPVAVLGFVNGFQFGTNYYQTQWALSKAGALQCWGDNTKGIIGDNSALARSIPTSVVGGYRFVRVAMAQTAYALNGAGRCYAWGDNSCGQIGDGTSVPRSSPVAILGGLQFLEIFPVTTGAGNFQDRVYAIDRDGNLYGWGANGEFALGQGSGDEIFRSSPVAIAGGTKFKKVVAGVLSAMGLAINGDVYAWGHGSKGELGNGDNGDYDTPQLAVGGHKFIDIWSCPNVGLDGASVFGLTADGDLYAWGFNNFGCLGTNDTNDRSSPTLVVGGLKWKRIAVGNTYVIGLATDGNIYGWGFNGSGQLGIIGTDPASSPTLCYNAFSAKFVEVGSFGITSFGYTSEGMLMTWGDNSSGQSGGGTNSPVEFPQFAVNGPAAGWHPAGLPAADTTDNNQQGLTRLSSAPAMIFKQVVAGQTYKVRLSGGDCTFDTDKIGEQISRIKIAYQITGV